MAQFWLLNGDSPTPRSCLNMTPWMKDGWTHYKKVNPSWSGDTHKYDVSLASDNEGIEVYTQLPSQAPSENRTSGTHSRSQILIQADDDTHIAN